MGWMFRDVRGDATPRSWAIVLAMAVAIIGALCSLASPIVGWSRWRETQISRAIDSGSPPAFWWPPAWRRELRTSLTLGGDLRSSKMGTLEVVSELDGRVFRTAVIDVRYTFKPRILPAGSLKVRFLAPDGSATGWAHLGELDAGRHRIDLAF